MYSCELHSVLLPTQNSNNLTSKALFV